MLGQDEDNHFKVNPHGGFISIEHGKYYRIIDIVLCTIRSLGIVFINNTLSAIKI
jgi:hypothetical protein